MPAAPVALLLLLASAEIATPVVTGHVEYYDVSGRTAAALRASMNARRPGGTSVRYGDGHTYWYVAWNYRYNGQSHCQLTSARVTLDIKTVLPRWIPPPSAPAELVARWNRYLRALESHEDGHAAHGRGAAQAVAERLGRIGSFPDCARLEAAIKQAGDETIAEYGRRDRSYDARTSHGATQGATFP